MYYKNYFIIVVIRNKNYMNFLKGSLFKNYPKTNQDLKEQCLVLNIRLFMKKLKILNV